MSADALMRLRYVGVARLSPQGDVRACNETFAQLARGGPAPASWSAARCFAQPALGELVERAGPLLHEGPLTLLGPDEVGRTFRGIVARDGDELLVVLEPETAAESDIVREVVELNAELAELQREQARVIAQLRRTEAELREALAAVRTLRGLLPICASCKRIRNDAGDWEDLERYVEGHTEAQMSHGICQRCLDKSLAEIDGG